MAKRVKLSDCWGKLTEIQREMERAVSSSQRVVLRCGRQVGKTEYLARLVVRAVMRGEQVWWIAPTHQLNTIGFRRCLSLVRLLPKEERRQYKAKRSAPYELYHRRSGGRATWLTSGNPDSLQGATLDLVVFDEAATEPALLDIIDQYLEPTLAVKRGKLVLASTPKGENDFAQICRSPDWTEVHAPTSANPLIDKEWLERQRERYVREGRLYLYEQEYEALINQAYGRYFEVSPRIEPCDEPEVYDYCGIDWGYSSPMAAVYITVDTNSVRVVRCLYETHLEPDEQARRILSRRARVYVCDSSTPEHVLQAWRVAGLVPLMGTRDRVGSLQIIRQLLAHDALVIDPSCTPLINEMENATYNIRRPEDMLGDDHAIDALRYAVWQAQTTLVSKRILQQRREVNESILKGDDTIIARIMQDDLERYKKEAFSRKRNRVV